MNDVVVRAPIGALLVFVLLAILHAGCSAVFSETYYVGVYDKQSQKPAQFYRFTVEGASSLFSKTQYEAGWYDADVVNELFGEINAPTSPSAGVPAGTPSPSGQIACKKHDNKRKFFRFGPEGIRNTSPGAERFVIFMHSDPRALTNRIRALLKRKTTQAALVKLLFAPKLVEEKKTIAGAETELKRAKGFAAKLKALIDDTGFDGLNADALRSQAIAWMAEYIVSP